MARGSARPRRGSALLAVLWVSAALAAIALSLASTVRGETERTSTAVDGLRSYYLAQAGVERATYEILWSLQSPDRRLLPRYTTQLDYNFPSGVAHVEIVSEAAKLDVNRASVEDLYRLGVALGIEPERSREIAFAIADWRAPAPGGSAFDSYYLSLTPSFRAPHASFEEIEELLLVKGVTPDIYYGTFVPAGETEAADTARGRLLPRQGLVDCLSVYGAGLGIDASSASPAVLMAAGLSAEAARALVQRRRSQPFTDQDLRQFLQSVGAPGDRLRVEGFSIVTIYGTGRLRLANGQLSDLKRTVAAQVKYMPPGFDAPIHILRWYDEPWRN